MNDCACRIVAVLSTFHHCVIDETTNSISSKLAKVRFLFLSSYDRAVQFEFKEFQLLHFASKDIFNI